MSSRPRRPPKSPGPVVLETVEALKIPSLTLTDDQRRMISRRAHARAVFSDHPAVDLGARRDTPTGPAKVSTFGAGAAPVGFPTSSPETTEGLPVLLVEARHALIYTVGSGAQAELQVQAMCFDGFTMWTGVAMLARAQGWRLRRRDSDHLELRGPRGLWAAPAVRPDPQWLLAAASQHDVLVIYGPTIGVREEPEHGHTFADDSQRRAELEEFRRIGFVAAGIVSFAP